MKKGIIVGLVLMMSSFSFTACSQQAAAPEQTTETVQEESKAPEAETETPAEVQTEAAADAGAQEETVSADGTAAAEEALEAADEGSADLPEEINIGVQTLVTPELLLREEGKYEEFLGTKVNLLQFDSGGDVVKALAAGSIDMGAMGTSVVSTGISNGIDMEVIWMSDVIGSAESLVAKGDAGISTLKDLEGKKVATPFVSTAHFSLLSALNSEGVDVSKVELLDMQPADIYAAWTRGDIDAAYVWYPVLGQLLAEDGVVLTDSEQQAKNGAITADLIVVSKAFSEKYPQATANYLAAQMYSVDTYKADEAAGITKMAGVLGLSDEETKQQADGFVYLTGQEQLGADYLGDSQNVGNLAKVLKDTADFLVEQGSITEAPELSVFEEAVTGRYIEDALK